MSPATDNAYPQEAELLSTVIPVPWVLCPGWDSNPHWMVFGTMASAKLGYQGASTTVPFGPGQ
jgi:hypothetical protein